MTNDELRADYDALYQGLRSERKWRDQVFPTGHPKREAKLAEMDKLIAIVVRWKDALKEHCEPEYEQPPLLDVPRKADYK